MDSQLQAEHNNLKFVIEQDLPDVGYYLYVYKKGKCVKDFLQNSVEICKEIALADFGVPLNKWTEKRDE